MNRIHTLGISPGLQTGAIFGACLQGLVLLGIAADERELIRRAGTHGWYSQHGEPQECPNLSPDQLMQLLREMDVTIQRDRGYSLEDLDQNLDVGVVLASVNAGEIWNHPAAVGNGDANHLILVTGVSREALSGRIEAIQIYDPLLNPPEQTVDGTTMIRGWLQAGGCQLVLTANA